MPHQMGHKTVSDDSKNDIPSVCIHREQWRGLSQQRSLHKDIEQYEKAKCSEREGWGIQIEINQRSGWLAATIILRRYCLPSTL